MDKVVDVIESTGGWPVKLHQGEIMPNIKIQREVVYQDFARHPIFLITESIRLIASWGIP